MNPTQARDRGLVPAYRMLGVLVLAYIVALLDRQIIALMVAPIKASMQLGDFEIALLQGPAFSIAFSLATIPAGIIVSRYNRRNALICGILLWSVGTAFCGFAMDFNSLFAARVVVGVGEAILSPAAFTMISDAFPRDRVVRATSIFTMSATLGVGIAFLAGGAVISFVEGLPLLLPGYERWQEAFWIISLPGFVLAVLLLLVREPARSSPVPDKRAKVIDALRLIRSKAGAFSPIYLCSGLLGVVYYAGFVWYATHLIRAFGFTPGQAGLLLGILFLCTSSVGTLLGVALSERLERRGVADAPILAVALFSAIAIFAGSYASVEGLYLSLAMLIVQSLALASFFGNLVAAMQIITPPALRGVNSAVFVLWNNLISLAAGASIVGALSDGLFAGDPRGLGHSITIVSVACSAASLVIALLGRRRYGAAAVEAGTA